MTNWHLWVLTTTTKMSRKAVTTCLSTTHLRMQAAQRVQHQQEEKNKKETKPDLKDDPRSIVVCISGLQESQIGQYTDFVKKKLELTRKMKDI